MEPKKDQATPDASKSETLDHYLIVKTLGEGFTGEVKLGRDLRTGTLYALKILEKTHHHDYEDALNGLKNELKFVKSVNHPNIIRLENLCYKGSYKAKGGTREVAYAVLEYAPRGEIFDLISRAGAFSENACRSYFKQFVSAMIHLHEKNIAHRDVKLENILLDEKLNLKLVDFGFATFVKSTEMNRTELGTPRYMAPEQLAHKQYDAKKVDVFASGIVLFILQTSRPPFLSADKTDKFYMMYTNNRNGFWNLHQNSLPTTQLSANFKQLVDAMLEADPTKRLTFEQVMASPWMQAPCDETAAFNEVAKYYQKTQQIISQEKLQAREDSKMVIEGTRSGESNWSSDVEVPKDDNKDNCFLIKTNDIFSALDHIKDQFTDKTIKFEKEDGKILVVINKSGRVSVARLEVWQISDDVFGIKVTKKSGDYIEISDVKTQLQKIIDAK